MSTVIRRRDATDRRSIDDTKHTAEKEEKEVRTPTCARARYRLLFLFERRL